MELLNLHSVTRTYVLGDEKVHAVRGVELALQAHSFVLLQGPSGSGKTTLLNIMGGLEEPDDGTVFYRGEDIYRLSERNLIRFRRREIGFVFQSLALFPRLTALENVDLGLRIAGFGPRENKDRATRFLDLMGLDRRMEHRVSELSGGEQQRVAVARALAPGPALLFADEPTGELDQKTGQRVISSLRSLVDAGELTVCLTSHDPAIAAFADTVHALRDGVLN
jgi:putative ABC transport system ATP-binding protein